MKPIKKPVLPSPTFRYGSKSYVLLSYAKMLNRKPFTLERAKAFSYRFDDLWDVKRTVDVLLRNGSIEEESSDSWKITPKGIQQIYDFAARHQLIVLNQQKQSVPQTKR